MINQRVWQQFIPCQTIVFDDQTWMQPSHFNPTELLDCQFAPSTVSQRREHASCHVPWSSYFLYQAILIHVPSGQASEWTVSFVFYGQVGCPVVMLAYWLPKEAMVLAYLDTSITATEVSAKQAGRHVDVCQSIWLAFTAKDPNITFQICTT